jgi:hypothetical protein
VPLGYINNTYDKAEWTTTRTTKDSEIYTRNNIADIDTKLLANERRRIFQNVSFNEFPQGQ